MGRGAVILAAGTGSRLRAIAPVKPLARVAGRPLLHHAIRALRSVGVGPVTVVTGHAGAEVAAALDGLPDVTAVPNPAWAHTPNGVSLLAARDHVTDGTLLLMADHLVAPALLERLVAGGQPAGGLALAVDRRLGHPAVDEADVTRVRTDGSAIVDIGKALRVWDCYDCGAFLIGPALLAALDRLPEPSLADGVRALARAGLARATDIGCSFWLDVDDARALLLAERALADRVVAA